MKVLLTGHQGYLGTIMAPTLAAAGHTVVGLDSGLYADCVLGPFPSDPPGYALDVRDVRAEHLAGFGAVVHLAALSNDPVGSLAPDSTYDINLHATVRLATLARDAGVRRFLYASTCTVYGPAGRDDLVGENAPLRPVTPYAESKVRAEDELFALADADFCPVSLRNATAFGFSPRLRADVVLNKLVGAAVLHREVRVRSDGTRWRQLVHVNDIATAFAAALDAPHADVAGRAFNIGAESNTATVREIAESAATAVPGATLVVTGETGPDPRSYRVDFSAARRALPGFVPRWSIGAGARQLHEAYTGHNLVERGFSRRYTRLTRLSDRSGKGELGPDLRPVALAVTG